MTFALQQLDREQLDQITAGAAPLPSQLRQRYFAQVRATLAANRAFTNRDLMQAIAHAQKELMLGFRADDL
jgi:hypothetical protein